MLVVLQGSFGSAGNYICSERQGVSMYATSKTHSTLKARLIVLTLFVHQTKLRNYLLVTTVISLVIIRKTAGNTLHL